MAYPSFYADELQTALGEQGSAIKSFSFLRSTDSDAEASITLLEEQEIHIVLSERGYAEVCLEISFTDPNDLELEIEQSRSSVATI